MDWNTIVSLLIGGEITFFASWWYYRKASEDLRREAEALRQESMEIRSISSELLRYLLSLIDHLDDAGVVEVKRDSRTGEPLAVRLLRVTHSATAKGVPSHDWKIILHKAGPAADIPARDVSVAQDILRDLRAKEQDDR